MVATCNSPHGPLTAKRALVFSKQTLLSFVFFVTPMHSGSFNQVDIVLRESAIERGRMPRTRTPKQCASRSVSAGRFASRRTFHPAASLRFLVSGGAQPFPRKETHFGKGPPAACVVHPRVLRSGRLPDSERKLVIGTLRRNEASQGLWRSQFSRPVVRS